ncbi:unnamed protein product [Mytilus edulis]|uniref:Novel STAND NTPase 3 domain-containing protein n=1 Tax=Mytilus edulis TaxID=6550 RepID=A0A8S3UNU9_MYTED|nr:unnamed protein product [Mytilus edulis]
MMKLLFETRAAKCILTSVASNDCIIVTGSSGCGKSSNIHHVACTYVKHLDEIIPVLTGPSDIIHYKHENIQQVFIVDDICGKETINKQTLQVWRDYSDKMIRIFKTVITEEQNKNNNDTVSNITRSKLLISCRLHIYKELQFQLDNFLTTKECNIVSPDLCLLQKEKRQMAKMYHLDDMIDEIMEVEGNVHYFPLLCKLSKDKNSEGVLKLFTAPEDSIKRI